MYLVSGCTKSQLKGTNFFTFAGICQKGARGTRTRIAFTKVGGCERVINCNCVLSSNFSESLSQSFGQSCREQQERVRIISHVVRESNKEKRQPQTEIGYTLKKNRTQIRILAVFELYTHATYYACSLCVILKFIKSTSRNRFSLRLVHT